ncbi:hypothetical protein [Aureivirga marina]|uniref:hypothetical protein n=1 Tax=Aureivirga marina TaxID=1182451 RepID=UPI0018CB402F|nr:hypothetical protein [Aureivirga marina]
MKNILKISLTFTILLISFTSFSQNFDVPNIKDLKEKNDYIKHEQDVLKAVNWLIETPINQETEKRKKVLAFVFAWASGSPYSFEIQEYVTNFKGENLIIFIGGWAKHIIETKDQNVLNGNVAGVQAIIKTYENNEAISKKNKTIEKFKKYQKKGVLKQKIQKLIQ